MHISLIIFPNLNIQEELHINDLHEQTLIPLLLSSYIDRLIIAYTSEL